MAKVHVHIHTKDASSAQVDSARETAKAAIEAAIQKVALLKNLLTDQDDRNEAQSSIKYLHSAKGKLSEILNVGDASPIKELANRAERDLMSASRVITSILSQATSPEDKANARGVDEKIDDALDMVRDIG